MRRSILLVIPLLLTGSPAYSQSADAQSSQALISEIRQLREELRTAIVTVERMQIIMYRLQVQQAAVNRVSQKLEEVRNRLTQAQRSKERMEAELKKAEDSLQDSNLDPATRKRIEGMAAQYRSSVEMFGNEIPPLQAREGEAQSALQSEQTKLAELEDWLNRLDKTLENFSRAPNPAR